MKLGYLDQKQLKTMELPTCRVLNLNLLISGGFGPNSNTI